MTVAICAHSKPVKAGSTSIETTQKEGSHGRPDAPGSAARRDHPDSAATRDISQGKEEVAAVVFNPNDTKKLEAFKKNHYVVNYNENRIAWQKQYLASSCGLLKRAKQRETALTQTLINAALWSIQWVTF